jgi:aryl-alcohol dehydrogenase
MSMRITAAVARTAGEPFSLEELTLEAPRADEVLLEVRGVGLCHTDIGARDGGFPLSFPFVAGHEGSGVVVEVGAEVTGIAVGDHVVASFNSCGNCPSCSAGDPSYCVNFAPLNYMGARQDGSSPLSTGEEQIGYFFGQSSFATHAIANVRNVVKVDKDLPLELLGMLGCGIQTGSGAVMRAMACREGSALLVLGAGPVGLAAVMAGAVQGCAQIIVSEPNPTRRDLALELGATHALDPTDGDLAEQVRAVLPQGVDYAFDTTGNPGVIGAAVGCMAHRGVIGLVGVPQDFTAAAALPLVPAMALGLTFRGITEGDSDPATSIPELIDLYRKGVFPFDRMVDRTYSLAELNDAIAAQNRGDVVKVVVVNPPAGATDADQAHTNDYATT